MKFIDLLDDSETIDPSKLVIGLCVFAAGFVLGTILTQSIGQHPTLIFARRLAPDPMPGPEIFTAPKPASAATVNREPNERASDN